MPKVVLAEQVVKERKVLKVLKVPKVELEELAV